MFARREGGPKFRAFCSLSRHHVLFLFSLGGSSREIVAAGWGHGLLKIVRLGFSGVILCKPPRPRKKSENGGGR